MSAAWLFTVPALNKALGFGWMMDDEFYNIFKTYFLTYTAKTLVLDLLLQSSFEFRWTVFSTED